MKFAISIFILWTSSLCANPINIFYESHSDDLISIKKILIDQYLIPEELISLKHTGKCGYLNLHGKMDLCLNKEGDLVVVSIDRSFISESLSFFYNK